MARGPETGSADGLIQVAQTHSLSEARIWQGLLASEAIPAHFDGLDHASVNWNVTIAGGGIRVWVPRTASDAASTALAPAESHSEPVLWEAAAFWRRPLIYAALVAIFWLPTVFPPWLRTEWRSAFRQECAVR